VSKWKEGDFGFQVAFDGSVAVCSEESVDNREPVRQHCETAMDWGEVLATGHWYESGAGEVFLVESWSSLKDL